MLRRLASDARCARIHKIQHNSLPLRVSARDSRFARAASFEERQGATRLLHFAPSALRMTSLWASQKKN